jgi:hypothetical protein
MTGGVAGLAEAVYDVADAPCGTIEEPDDPHLGVGDNGGVSDGFDASWVRRGRDVLEYRSACEVDCDQLGLEVRGR